MAYHLDDTIVAVASPPGGAARGIVRLSGPSVVECISRIFTAGDSSLADGQSLAPSATDNTMAMPPHPTAVAGILKVTGIHSPIPADLYLWPEGRSYTGQNVAEFHVLGSPPLLETVVETVCASGARPAAPGEFTLRAFMSGRIDLTQAEAVLGVIDATDPARLDVALEQLAGGLSRPLLALRATLVDLLAHLEAGFDFPDEDISFITHAQLAEQLRVTQESAVAIREQLRSRHRSGEEIRVVLAGEPNAGKSSLFNALTQRAGAIVSHHPGTTRDYLSAEVEYDGVRFTLIDTAGVDPTDKTDEANQLDPTTISQAATLVAHSQSRQADLKIWCIDPSCLKEYMSIEANALQWCVYTKADLLDQAICENLFRDLPETILVSSTTGYGLDALRTKLAATVCELQSSPDHAVATTSARCSESLREAVDAIEQACRLADQQHGEELVAAEIRTALDAVGRVAGVVYTDDVLDNVFHRFCVGK